MADFDARFEDGDEAPLRLKALDGDDIPIISALVQDAVFPITEMTYDRAHRRFALLLNRFRWEDPRIVGSQTPERVQSVLAFEDVLKVSTQGIDRSDSDMVLSLMTLNWIEGPDGTGRIELVLSGDGAVALDVECIEISLRDVTRPYVAPSGHVPKHPE